MGHLRRIERTTKWHERKNGEKRNKKTKTTNKKTEKKTIDMDI